MRSVKLKCPNSKCRVALTVPEKRRGQRVRCAGCGQSFIVPAQQGPRKRLSA